MRIGIFGGTFDPPHHGHLILAAEAINQLNLDKVIWTLTANPPHKLNQEITAVYNRLELLQAAIGDNPDFILSRIEMDRPGPHYAVDTIKILQQQNPDADLIFLIGADSLRDLPTWHKPKDLVRLVAELGVMQRPDITFDLVELETHIPGLNKKLKFFHTPLIEISASQIRERVRSLKPYRYFVPEKVYRIIEDLRLYRNSGTNYPASRTNQ